MNGTGPGIVILETDIGFTTSPDVGELDCLCSRCLKLIEERTLPIRAWTPEGNVEYRYHPACLGIEGLG